MKTGRARWGPAWEIAGRLRRLPQAKRHPLERGEDLQPFFLVGSGRSGNTLVRRLLQACPGVFIPPELPALGESLRLYRRHRLLPWRELLQTTLAPFAFDADFARFGPSLPQLAERLEALAPERRSLAAVVDALVRAHAPEPDAALHWGDKTPAHVFALEPLREVFPRARFVHVLRDGVDVAHSYVEAGLQPDLEAAARRWRAAVRAARAFAARHPERLLELRYEDLVAEPRSALAPVLRFLELEPGDPSQLRPEAFPDLAHHAHLRRALDPVDASSVGKGRRALEDDAAARLQRRIGAELAATGYPPASSSSSIAAATRPGTPSESAWMRASASGASRRASGSSASTGPRRPRT